MMKIFTVCWRVVRSRNLRTMTVLILSTTVLVSCSLIMHKVKDFGSTYELNPVKISGCIGDFNNPCATMDITTPNDRTGVCSQMGPNGWAYRVNKYLIKSTTLNNYPNRNGVFPRPGQGNCKNLNRHNNMIIDGEYAISRGRPFMTISGDVCSNRPTINIHRYKGDWLLRPGNYSRQPEPEKFTDPTYPFYVGSHSIPWMESTAWMKSNVDKSLLMVKELFATQCGVVPDEIRISGRLTPLPQRKPRSRALAGKYTSHEIYTGTYYPNASRFKVIHDDKEMAKAHYDLALARKEKIENRILDAKRAAKKRLEKAKVGGALLFGILFGIHQASPCNDPNLSEAGKPYFCPK